MTETGYGWTGKILRVDLSHKTWSIEKTASFAGRFIGGVGLGYKILWDEIGPEVGAFDPENRLIFATGPLTGTLAPTSGRFEVISKSPRSYPMETVSRSGMGGAWGPELKFAGYDALIVQGKAERWTNLLIHNDSIEFRDANGYLGQDTYSTQNGLREEFDRQAKVLCIGPAGEKLSRLAIILSETSFASGRSGFGAVMGSKNLKGIAVRGTRRLNISDPERLIEISKRAMMLMKNDPRRAWTTRIMPPEERDLFINRYRKKNVGCFGCPVQCFAYMDVPGVGQCAAHCIDFYYYPAATQYSGDTTERDRAVAAGYVLANRLGLDTFEFWQMVKFLKDLYDAGLIKSEPDLPLDSIGNRDFVEKLLHLVARREGMGDLLAEGCSRTADKIRDGWKFCSNYFPAYGSAAHGNVRGDRGVALQWALDSRCPIIDQHSYVRVSASLRNDPLPYKIPEELLNNLARKVYGSERAVDGSTFDQKPEMVVYGQNRSGVKNALVLCDWVFPMMSSYATQDRLGDTSMESKLLEAVTGYRLSEEGLDRIGERIWNLSRAIMVTEGRTRDLDTLHESYFVEQGGMEGIAKEDFEKAKTRYYHLRGWNENTGRPTRQKLEELDLKDIADRLEEMQLLG